MPAQPQDHKAKKVVDDSPTFEWTAPGGAKVTLTKFENLPAGVFRKVRGLDDMDATFTLVEAGTNADGLEVIDALPLHQLNALFDAWSAGSGVALPES